MFVAAIVLSCSTGLLLFYFQVVCQKILRRRFAHDYYHAVVSANRLEFPTVRRSVAELGASLEYSLLRVALRCDFMVLTYLLKNSANVYQRFTFEEQLLILYFRLAYVCLATRHWLRWKEESAVLRLTAVLEYFANVVGERVSTARFASLTAADFLEN